jgi:mRNA interferase MazF
LRRNSNDEGMLQDCAVDCDHIQTVSKSRLGALLATLSAAKMREVSNAVAFALGLGR